MARPPKFRIPALADLLQQLRYAPPETKRRQMDAAERLIDEIERERAYPFDYVEFRITSFRAEGLSGEPELYPGAALIADLATFVERLSDSLAWKADAYAPRRALTAAEVEKRLNVSSTTLHRYRKQGLVAHQVIGPSGRKRVCFFEDSLDRFIRGREEQIEHAARYSRVDEPTMKRMIARARRYRKSLGLSLNEAAHRLAKRFDRSPEAMRQLLLRHDESHPDEAIFPEGGPLNPRSRRVIHRAWRFGAPIPLLADRFGRSRSTIYRIINEERLAKLEGFELTCLILPTFQLDEADEIILSPPAVRTGYDPEVRLGGDGPMWAERASATDPPEEDVEAQWFGALNYLLYSGAEIRAMARRSQPGAHDLDVIETRLRWATQLKRRILAAFQRPILRTLELHVGRKLVSLSAGEIQTLHAAGMRVAIHAVESFDPRREQRFETYLVFGLRRELARAPYQSPAGRAAPLPRRSAGSVTLNDPTCQLDPWQEWVQPRNDLRPLTDRLDNRPRELVRLRYGWSGEAPMTHVELSKRLDLTPERVAAIERRAMRELRREARRAGAE